MASIFWSLPAWLAQDRILANWWALDPVIPPEDEPITIQDVKVQARIDGSNRDDVSVAGMLVAARMQCEKITNRSFLPQTWSLSIQSWPTDRIILPRAPLISAGPITWTDISENSQIVPSSTYDVNLSGDPGSVVLRFGQIWPPSPLSPSNPIRTQFQAGYPRFAGLCSIDSTGKIITDLDSPGLFNPQWTSLQTIIINGYSNIIQSVQSPSQLTLYNSSNFANLSSIPWSVNLVPQPIKLAIMMLATHWYGSGRTPVVVGRGVTSSNIDKTVDTLLSPYRISVMGLKQTLPTGYPIWP